MTFRQLKFAALALPLLLPLLATGPLAAQNKADTPKEDSANEPDAFDKIGDTVENIGTKPLKDLNIIKAKVVPELEAVMEAPYSLKGLRTCKQLRAEIAKFEAILGPDVDSATARNKKGQTPAEFALGAAESVAGGIIPFSGLIRMISGADKRQKFARAAVYAGSVRRAHLKGVAIGRKCR